MQFKNNSVLALLITIIIFIALQACAGMGSMRGQNVRIYHENIDKMIDITRQAIQNKGYSVISFEQRAETKQRTTIRFVKRSAVGKQMVSSMQAYVFLANSDTADAVEVRVNNPDYNYGTPTDQRIDYANVLFKEIDKLLE